MNHSPFWPLVWKEYRVGRSFWLAMAIMGLVAQAGVWWLVHQTPERDWWLYGIALMFSAGFAVGIGGTLFAVEHEEQTLALLRRLPVRAGELGAAKIFCAAGGLVLLLALLWSAAAALAAWRTLPELQGLQLWRSWGLACLEGLAWGILWSLVIRSPLQATMVAALTVVLIDASSIVPLMVQKWTAATLPQPIFYRVIILALVAMADLALLPRWLEGRFTSTKSWRQICQARWQAVRGAVRIQRRPFAQLIWQTFREGWASALTVFIAVVAPLLAFRLFRLTTLGSGYEFSVQFQEMVLLVSLLPALVAAVIGSLEFRADQRQGPRFLAVQGVSPRAIWLSRQLVWAVLLACIVVAVDLALLPVVWSLFPYPWVPASLFRLLSPQFLLPAYAVGQFTSLIFRRGLLAVVFGMMFGGLITFWTIWMGYFGAGWWWSVLPLVVGLLLATWLRMPTWLLERSSWRAWMAPAAAAGVPLVALLIAVPAFRVWQIPEAPAFQLALPASSPTAIAAARLTIDGYRQAWDRLKIDRPEGIPGNPLGAVPATDWMKPVADEVIQASRGGFNLLVLPVPERRAAVKPIQELHDFLLEYAHVQTKAGELETALEAYLASLPLEAQLQACNGSHLLRFQVTFQGLCEWSAAPGQTVALIQRAIKELQECHARFPSPGAWIAPLYEENALAISDLPAAIAAEVLPPSEGVWISSRFPWERARAERLLVRVTNACLLDAKEVLRMLGQKLPLERTYSAINALRPLYYSDDEPLWLTGNDSKFWVGTTPLVDWSNLVRQNWSWLMHCQETDYRATLIILALEAWRIEHGQLPDTLDELAGAQLETVPLDPLFARPFLYFPKGSGATSELVFGMAPNRGAMQPGVFYRDGTEQRLSSVQPILWSALNERGPWPAVALVNSSDRDPKEFPYYGIQNFGRASDERSRALSDGTSFVIPAANPAASSKEGQP